MSPDDSGIPGPDDYNAGSDAYDDTYSDDEETLLGSVIGGLDGTYQSLPLGTKAGVIGTVLLLFGVGVIVMHDATGVGIPFAPTETFGSALFLVGLIGLIIGLLSVSKQIADAIYGDGGSR